MLNEQPSLVYLYGFSLVLESKLNTVKEIIENQLNLDAQIHFVFIHDAVIGTTLKYKTNPLVRDMLQLPIKFYSMIPDLKARGLDSENLHSGIEGINYEDLVDLIVISSKIVSWM